MDDSIVKALAAMCATEHSYDGSTVGVEAVPTDESLLCDKLKEERDWRPYCLKCSTFSRMSRREYGFQCVRCENKVNWDMTHYDDQESKPQRPAVAVIGSGAGQALASLARASDSARDHLVVLGKAVSPAEKEPEVQPSNKLKRPIVLSAAMADAMALGARHPGTYDDIARIGGLPRSAPAFSNPYSPDSPEVKAMPQPKKSKKAKAKAKKNRK